MSKKPQKRVNEISSMSGGSVEGASSNSHFIDREEFLKELQLREAIRKIISVTENKKQNQENLLRKTIGKFITEAETDKTPHASTAINFLEDLLKKILPGVEQDYKSLTTNKEQRDSFRSQLVSSVNTLLETADINVQAAREKTSDAESEFIDIEEEITDKEAYNTGSKLAAQSFDAIEKQILETYNTLSDEEDQKTFKDYLITNLKLYFDKWEKELGDVIEPTTDEYETEKEDTESEDAGEELGGEEGLEAEEEFEF